MKTFCTPGCLHNLLGFNIALGLLAFVVAVYFIIGGEFVHQELHKSTATLLNTTAIGGLIYSAASWYVDLLIHPQHSKSDS